ncbi:MAG TPA: hypothetical protein VMG10_10330 [Gemmataceae bacterium]|nr:hypothetical protein [Gemmataceae bacterium]
MPDFLTTHYGTTEGPLGFPMPDRAAQTLDSLLKSLPRTPEHEYRHLVTTKAPTEVNLGERSDVSWISSESPDRTREVVAAKGMNDAQFSANPIVTLGHAYYLPPVGKSLWRKRVRDGQRVGIKAKTAYPVRPEAWPAQDAWPPDQVFALIQAGLLQGKSIGFLPTRVHIPDSKEVQKNGWNDNVDLVIDEWLLLEYACVFLPANQDALVESVAKGSLALADDVLQALGLSKQVFGDGDGGTQEHVIAFTSLDEIHKAVLCQIAAIDFDALAEKTIKETFYKSCGRV